MRATFAQCLYDLARRDKRILLLIGDIGGGLFAKFKADMPDQFFNMGICEQAAVGVAAGMAMGGFRPVVYTITPFLIERAFEQIKIDVNLQKLPVGLVGHQSSTEGPTHRCLDVHTIMGLCQNITSFYPENKAAVTRIMASVNLDAPWFLSLTPDHEQPKHHDTDKPGN